MKNNKNLDREAKEILFDLFEYFDDYKDIVDSLRSMLAEEALTEEEYNYIIETYDIYLDQWLKIQDQKQAEIDSIETYKHYIDLFRKTLTYLSSYLIKNNVGYYDEINIYKEIGFNEDDLDYFGLRDYAVESEIDYFEGVKENE